MGGSESALGTDSFRATYDIVGSLPLELVLVIAKDLDPVDIVRGQRVRIAHSLMFKVPISYFVGLMTRSRNGGGPFSRPIRLSCLYCAKPWCSWT